MRDAGADGASRALRRARAARRSPHHGQPAHDGADGGSDRDARRPRCRRPLGVVQHLLDAGPRCRGRRRRPGRNAGAAEGHSGVRVEGRDARGILVVHAGGAGLARRQGPDADRRRRRRRHAAGPQGTRVRAGRCDPRLRPETGPRGMGRDPRPDPPRARGASGSVERPRPRRPRRLRRDDDRRPSPLPDGEGRHAAVPGDQRQRLRHQEQVRQHLRLPALVDRRPEPRDGRDARRQGRRRLRLRRGRQGLRAVAARPGLPGPRDRDRPDLRAAGRDGGLRGHDSRRCRSRRPTCSSRRPATPT